MSHYRLGQKKWVFIDWMNLFPGYGADYQNSGHDRGFLLPHGVELRAHRPRPELQPVLTAEHPWEAHGIHPFSTFMEDDGVFRCWYHLPQDDAVFLGYAESDDGVTWRKPTLNLFEVNGSKANNLVDLPPWEGREQSFHVFRDPSAGPAERYKLVSCCDQRDCFALYGAVSPDGLSWTRRDEPILKNRSDTHSIGAYDETLGQYVVYTRQQDNVQGRRGINRAASADFWHFQASEPVLENSPLDPPDWDYYCSAYSPWPGAVDAHIMRFTMYYRATDTLDVHLATSRDGRLWHRPLGQEPWLGGINPSIYACAGILPTGPGEWSTYFGHYPQGHYIHGQREPAEICRAVMREDGFMSLSATGPGEVWTIPFTLESDRIGLNVKTAGTGWLKAALMVADGNDAKHGVITDDSPVPYFRDFTFDDCVAVTGDHHQTFLEWRGDLAKLRGKDVHLHLKLFNTDLFALHF